MKNSFKLGKMKIDKHPIAFLLILCDELQEWNRRGYSENDIGRVNPEGINLNVNNDRMEISYFFGDKHVVDAGIFKEKQQKILDVLDCRCVFKKGFIIKQGGKHG